MEGRITHGGNPVMAWMAGNVVVALDRCIRNEGQQQGSVYDERDMIVF